MKQVFVLLIVLFPMTSNANCWVVGDLKGQSVRATENLEFDEDSISDKKFIIEIDDKTGSLTPTDLSCAGLSNVTLFCGSLKDSGASVFEVWTVYPEAKKVTFTNSRAGYGVFDGASLFVGDILGECDE